MMRRAIPLFVVMIVAMPGAAEQPRAAKGNLVLVGGGEKPPDAMRKFIELAGGPSGSILVVPTASGEPDTNDYYRALFEKDYGCSNVTPLELKTRADAMSVSIAEKVRGAGGIFFSGGDQTRIIEALRETPVGAAIDAAFRRGAAIGGTSAGTACMSPLMITGEGNFEVIQAGSVELWPGLGFFDGVIVDQHFIARQRENRLFTVILEHPELLGVGVDEDTAVWIRPDRTFEVLGDRSVIVLDAAGAEITKREADPQKTYLGVHGMRLHILHRGEVFDLAKREIVARTMPGAVAGQISK